MNGVRRAVRAVVLAAPMLLVIAGCAPAEPAPLVPRPVTTSPAATPASPCQRVAADGAEDTTPAPRSGQVAVDRAAGHITVGAGPAMSLPALSRAVADPALLRETAPGRWLLGADLVIAPGASLTVAAPGVRRLDLSSSNDAKGRFVAVRVMGGSLTITGVCVTSWDAGNGHADTNMTGGRSYLLARDGAAMNIDSSELRYLGYPAVESYGLSWRLQGTTGRLTGSIVSDNYYGVYSYEVSGLAVTDDEVSDNIVYGIDPHTGSHNLMISRNVVHDNAKHGIILAEDCVDSVISDNVVFGNAQHGIVLYLRSDRNSVTGNSSYHNGAQGININESNDNTVSGNLIYDNAESGVAVAESSSDNVLTHNDIRDNQQDGVRLVSLSEGTSVLDNLIGQNTRYGVYVDGDQPFTLTGNTIFRSQYGIALTSTTQNPQAGNTFFGHAKGDVRQVT